MENLQKFYLHPYLIPSNPIKLCRNKWLLQWNPRNLHWRSVVILTSMPSSPSAQTLTFSKVNLRYCRSSRPTSNDWFRFDQTISSIAVQKWGWTRPIRRPFVMCSDVGKEASGRVYPIKSIRHWPGPTNKTSSSKLSFDLIVTSRFDRVRWLGQILLENHRRGTTSGLSAIDQRWFSWSRRTTLLHGPSQRSVRLQCG